MFSLPVQNVKILFRGMVLKDDRVSLLDYGLQTGSRVVLAVNDAEHRRQAQAKAAAHAQPGAGQAPPAPQAAQAAGVPQPPLQSVPPGTAPFAGAPGATAAPGQGAPPQQQQQPAPPPEPELSPEEKHMQQIAKIEATVRDTLLPELVQFEKSIASLPDAAKGAQTVANEGSDLIPTTRIPVTQRKLSEYLLRELMKLDGVPADTEQMRTARKSTVKEIQGLLDRVDTAWKSALESKGVVNDI